jgi:hypothetical protein
MIEAGQGTLSPIDSGNAWKIQSQKIAGDPGQGNAVRHVLGSTDFLTAIAGKPGVGKTTVIRETADAIRALSGQEPMMLAATASALGRLDAVRPEALGKLQDVLRVLRRVVTVTDKDFRWLRRHFALEGFYRIRPDLSGWNSPEAGLRTYST